MKCLIKKLTFLLSAIFLFTFSSGCISRDSYSIVISSNDLDTHKIDYQYFRRVVDRERFWRIFIDAEDDLFDKVWYIDPRIVGRYTLDLTIHQGDVAVNTQWHRHWAEMIEYVTNGGLTINVHYGGTLLGSSETFVGISSGVADLGWIPISIFPSEFPIGNFFNLPFLGFGDTASFNTSAFWDVYEWSDAWQNELSEFHIIALYSTGGNFYMSNEPITTLDEFNGMMIRAAGGIPATLVTTLGGIPISINSVDLYEAMFRGVVDGYLFDISGVNAWGLQEVTAYYSSLDLFTTIQSFLLNMEAFKRLPTEYQDVIKYFSGREMSIQKARHWDTEAKHVFSTTINRTQIVEFDSASADKAKQITLQSNRDHAASVNIYSFDAQVFLDFVMERAVYHNEKVDPNLRVRALAWTQNNWWPY